MNQWSDARYDEYARDNKKIQGKHDQGIKEILDRVLKNPAYEQLYINLEYKRRNNEGIEVVYGDIDYILVHEKGKIIIGQHKCHLTPKNYGHAIDQSHRSLQYVRENFKPKKLIQIVSGNNPIEYRKIK